MIIFHCQALLDDRCSLEDFYAICKFPEHKEFVNICRDAENQAIRTGQKTHFWWRGYRGIVAANLPPMTVSGMEVRLMNALSKIPMKNTAETMVINKNQYNLHMNI